MKIDVSHLAKLANLPLSSKERKKFAEQLLVILDYISQLSKISTEKVEPTSQVTGLENVLREDNPAPSLSQEEVLQNAPQKHQGFFKVKAIFKE